VKPQPNSLRPRNRATSDRICFKTCYPALIRKLDMFVRNSKPFLVQTVKRPLSPAICLIRSKDQNPVHAAQISHDRDSSNPSAKKPGHRLALPNTDFQGHLATGPEPCPALGCDLPVGIQPVFAAIKRQHRVVPGHLAGQRGKIPGRDVGRVGNDQVETLVDP
jgi:hypothetical protein